MTKNVRTVSKAMTLRELEHLFQAYDFDGVPVVEGQLLIGFVTKFDFLQRFIFNPNSVYPHYEQLLRQTVEEVMTRKVSAIHPTTPVTRALQMIVETRHKSLPVADEQNRLVGMISRGDIIRAMKHCPDVEPA